MPKKTNKPAAKAVTELPVEQAAQPTPAPAEKAQPTVAETIVALQEKGLAAPAEWIRFTEGTFRLLPGGVVRFLHKEPKAEKPLLREGKIKELFGKNYMTFVKVTDLADGTERDVMLQSIVEVQRV